MCNPDGQWFRHPESNRVWTNYTQCQAYTKDKLKVKHSNVVQRTRDAETQITVHMRLVWLQNEHGSPYKPKLLVLSEVVTTEPKCNGV